MFDLARLGLFFGAAFVVLVMPGPAVLYIVTQAMDRGPKYGVASSTGIALGGLVHVAAAVLGLSALLASSATAFLAVKYLGAAYLIYLGVQKFREREKPVELEIGPGAGAVSPRRVFWQGVVVEILNPKVALFFLSFLPQFVDPRRGNPSLQILVLGLAYVALALVTDTTYALVTAKLGRRMLHRMKGSAISRRAAGSIYIGLGLLTAFSGAKKAA